MDFSIIILNYKQKNLVKNCLKNILALNLNFKYEIIVIDNASRDGCLEMIKKEFPSEISIGKIRLIESKVNHGYASGNNLGIKEARGKYILILNPDITVLNGSIEKMLQFMEKNPDCAICGPKLLNPDKSIQISSFRFPKWYTPIFRRTFLKLFNFAKKELEKYQMLDLKGNETREADWLMGACVIIRKAAIEKVGLMDEHYRLYFEDTDWCKRFWKAGYKVYYFPQAEMIHFHQRLSAQEVGLKSLFNPSTRTHIISAIKYFWKWRKK